MKTIRPTWFLGFVAALMIVVLAWLLMDGQKYEGANEGDDTHDKVHNTRFESSLTEDVNRSRKREARRKRESAAYATLPVSRADTTCINKWYETITRNPHGAEANNAFREIQKYVKDTGDYKAVFTLMDSLAEREARSLIQWGIGVKSTLGLEHDVAGQLELANYFGDNKSAFYERKVFENLGGRRLDELAKSKLPGQIDQQQFLAVCYGAVREGADHGFKAAQLAPNETLQKSASAYVTKAALRQNSMRASAAIVDLPDGVVRNEALATMIGFLLEKGNEDEAKSWLGEISDGEIKRRSLKLFESNAAR